MPTITYWSTLFLCLFFINNSQDYTPTMELNQNLKKITQSIKAIQKHCKENDLDIKTLLSKEELKEYQSSIAFVKKYGSEIKEDGLTSKTVAANNTDQDISEPAFVDAVLQWRKKITKAFKEAKKNYTAVNLNTESFSKEIASNASALPLNTALYKEWAETIAKLPNPSKGETVFDALLNSNSRTWILTSNVNTLTLHYRDKANKKIYKQYDNNIGDFITDALPQISAFITAIEASAASDDPNLPENLEDKAAVDKEKTDAYQKVLNAWLDREVANLKFSGHDDTLYIDASSLAKDDGSSVMIHNFPIKEKNALLGNIKKEVAALKENEPSLLDVARIVKLIITDFHTQMTNENAIYEELNLKEVLEMKFPTGIDSWVLSHKLPEITASKDAKFLAYEKVFSTWYDEEHDTLSKTNASEDIRIDPSKLNIKSNTFSNATIPDLMIQQLANNLKKALEREEKEKGILFYNEAALAANDVLESFRANYNPNRRAFNYKDLSLEQIEVLQFPSGIATWIKEARIKGEESKDDIKNKIKLQLEMTNNFNLEALIKELKIDMGGITINNDFNFDNDLHLSYNNLKLILDKLVEINKPKKSEKKKPKPSSNASTLSLKGFKVTYCKGYFYGMDLEIPFELKKDEDKNCKLTFEAKTMETLNDSASVLSYFKNSLEKIGKISIDKGEETQVKINFSVSYKYNRAIKIVRKKDSGYTISELGAGAGAAISLRFVELSIGADAKYTVISGSDGEEVHESSPNITFTDYYTLVLNIKNKDGNIEFGIDKDVSFANSSYSRLLPKYDEQVQICGPLEIK